jgi:hypothetical protein
MYSQHDNAAEARSDLDRQQDANEAILFEILDTDLTDASKRLFIAYAKDAGNWNGTPLVGGNVGGSKEDRGNLTDLKRRDLIETFREDGCLWLAFTTIGRAYALHLGIRTIANEVAA